MAAKAGKTTKSKKTATKTATKAVTKKVTKEPVIKSSVTGKKEACWDKPAIGKIVCFCVVIIAIIVVAAAIALKSQGINDNFFVSDATKYVLNVPADENEDGVVGTHAVYYYKDDAITGAEYYYEFKDSEAAKTFYDLVSSLGESDEESGNYELSGKYVIAIADEDDYADTTASEIKAYVEFYEQIINSNEANEAESEETEE